MAFLPDAGRCRILASAGAHFVPFCAVAGASQSHKRIDSQAKIRYSVREVIPRLLSQGGIYHPNKTTQLDHRC